MRRRRSRARRPPGTPSRPRPRRAALRRRGAPRAHNHSPGERGRREAGAPVRFQGGLEGRAARQSSQPVGVSVPISRAFSNAVEHTRTNVLKGRRTWARAAPCCSEGDSGVHFKQRRSRNPHGPHKPHGPHRPCALASMHARRLGVSTTPVAQTAAVRCDVYLAHGRLRGGRRMASPWDSVASVRTHPAA